MCVTRETHEPILSHFSHTMNQHRFQERFWRAQHHVVQLSNVFARQSQISSHLHTRTQYDYIQNERQSNRILDWYSSLIDVDVLHVVALSMNCIECYQLVHVPMYEFLATIDFKKKYKYNVEN